MNTAIQITNLAKSYGSRAVLKGLNFKVRKGEIFALLGVNGAGKTTALECIEGLRKYDGGHITVNGKMGIQLQSATLPAHIKPMEAIKLFSKWNQTKVSLIPKALGVEEFSKRQYIELSTGQKRRLHLALALIRNPDIVFLDEPTAGLDVEGRISLHTLIHELKAQGKTIILASHDMAEVESLCDRLAILHEGTIAFVGTVEELTERVGRHYTICIKTEKNEEHFETEEIRDTLFNLLEDYRQKQLAILELKIDRGTLEQHFLRLVKEKDK